MLTRPDCAKAIRTWGKEHPNESVTVVEVPLPGWARLAPCHRIGQFLVYAAWLRQAGRRARELLRECSFDVVHHASYSTYWLPTPAVELGHPSVWGPVGGAVTTPLGLWPVLGWLGMLDEILDLLSVRACAHLPATRRTWQRATFRLLQNQATLAGLPPAQRSQSKVLNHCLFVDVPPSETGSDGGYILWPSALQSRKGPRLAIRALATTPPDVRLVMLGEGPEREAVERLTHRLGMSKRVELRGGVPREEVFELMKSASAILFTGLREEGGLALAEAMMVGKAVIVLAHGGAGTLARRAVDTRRVVAVDPGSVGETARRLGEAMTRFVREPPPGSGPLLDQAAALEELEYAFRRAVSERERQP